MKKQYEYREILSAVTAALRASGVDCHLMFTLYHDTQSDKSATLFVGDPANYQTPQFHVTGKEGRVVFGPCWHLQYVKDDRLKHTNYKLPNGFAMDSITISADKEPAAIAKQFRSRMLDAWLPRHAEAMTKLNEEIDWADTRVERMKSLGIKDRFDSERHTILYQRSGPTVSGIYFTPDCCNVEISGVGYETLKKILELLKVPT